MIRYKSFLQLKQMIRNYIIDSTYLEINDLDNSTLIFKEGILDSMGFLRLITFIEEEFEMQIYDDELIEENFESINAISEYIFNKNRIKQQKD